MISEIQAAVPLRISSLHPAEHWSPILPGRAKTSLSYEEAILQVIIPPPLNLDSIRIVAYDSPAMMRLRLRKLMALGVVSGG